METDRSRRTKRVKKVILDTSILMDVNEFKVDIISLLGDMGFTELLVPESVVKELERMRDDVNARVALMLLDRLKIVPSEGYADDAIMELARRERASVCTVDRELMEKLKKEKINVIYLRQRKRLESC
ncbi:MAG: DNA-binding protein [Archaeoglobi archaeon]|nr:DNA-binding protein [Candidatus Mnemosynella bozhongmuii]